MKAVPSKGVTISDCVVHLLAQVDRQEDAVRCVFNGVTLYAGVGFDEDHIEAQYWQVINARERE